MINNKFVVIPISMTLEANIIIELQDGESLETLSTKELEKRALTILEEDKSDFYTMAEETEVEVGVEHACYMGDDDDDDC